MEILIVKPRLNTLLNQYPAVAAYSLRRLKRDYSGSAIRVRRSSDGLEQDIGFSGNNLDTVGLLGFVGADNGFVTTWYDQSGNVRNATQTGLTSQPSIVSNGVLNIINGNPTILFDGVNDFFALATTFAVGGVFILLNALDGDTFKDFNGIFSGGSSNNSIGNNWTVNGGNFTIRAIASPVSVGIPRINGVNTASFSPLANFKIAISNNIVTGVSDWQIGKDRGNTARCWWGNISEVIAYGNVLSTQDMVAIERQQSKHYSVPITV